MSKAGLKAVGSLFMWLGLCVLGCIWAWMFWVLKQWPYGDFFSGWFLLVFAWVSLIVAMKVILDD